MTQLAIIGVAVVTIGLFWLVYFVNYHLLQRAGVYTLPKQFFLVVTWSYTIAFIIISIIALLLSY